MLQGNSAERNGSLREYVAQLTELEPLGRIRGTNDCYQAKCTLPGCDDPAQSLYISIDGDKESFECYERGREGGLDEFEALMNSNAFGRVIHIPDRRAAYVTPMPVEWYWEGRIPKG